MNASRRRERALATLAPTVTPTESGPWSVRVKLVSLETPTTTTTTSTTTTTDHGLGSSSTFCPVFRLGIVRARRSSDGRERATNGTVGEGRLKCSTVKRATWSPPSSSWSSSRRRRRRDDEHDDDDRARTIRWDEEFRWDGVSERAGTNLVVELRSRATDPRAYDDVSSDRRDGGDDDDAMSVTSAHSALSSLNPLRYFQQPTTTTTTTTPQPPPLRRTLRRPSLSREPVAAAAAPTPNLALCAGHSSQAFARRDQRRRRRRDRERRTANGRLRWREHDENDDGRDDSDETSGEDEKDGEDELPWWRETDRRIAVATIPLTDVPLRTEDVHFESVYVGDEFYEMTTEDAVSFAANLPTSPVATTASSSSPSPPPPPPPRHRVRLKISVSSLDYLDDSEDEYFDRTEDRSTTNSARSRAREALASSLVTNSLKTITTANTTAAAAAVDAAANQNRRRSSFFRDPSKVDLPSLAENTTAAPSPLPRRASALSRSLEPRDSRRRSRKAPASTTTTTPPVHGPAVEPGALDCVFVAGARGPVVRSSSSSSWPEEQDDDEEERRHREGWLPEVSDSCVLERFPPDDSFHAEHGRPDAVLADRIDWFCFPEGCRLWRGVDPPTAADLGWDDEDDDLVDDDDDDDDSNDSDSDSDPNAADAAEARGWRRTVATRRAHPSFDDCLNCASSLTWFVTSTASVNDVDEGRTVKTYGTAIRFYVPAPEEEEDDDDDDGHPSSRKWIDPARRRRPPPLWVPLAICVLSKHAMVGVMEAILLRICEALGYRRRTNAEDHERWLRDTIHRELAWWIVNCPAPVPGFLHTSAPFLHGERLRLTAPSPRGLPALPHGASVASACRLLGADGVATALAAALTEDRVVLRSRRPARAAAVGEVLSALLYPFEWASPYVPVLPDVIADFVESPTAYVLGASADALRWIDPAALDDAVVIDLDGRRRDVGVGRAPTPLPPRARAAVRREVYRLLRQEDAVDETIAARASLDDGISALRRALPRLEDETRPEREFRVAVAAQICRLLRGYRDHTFFVSSAQPCHFHRDGFLRGAPALFDVDDDEPTKDRPRLAFASERGTPDAATKRFLGSLVNTQHFHVLLESSSSSSFSSSRRSSIDHGPGSFFQEIMDCLQKHDNDARHRKREGSNGGGGGTTAPNSSSSSSAAASFSSTSSVVRRLCNVLEKDENRVPTYRAEGVQKSTISTMREINDRHMNSNLDDLDEMCGGIADLDANHQLGPKSYFTRRLLRARKRTTEETDSNSNSVSNTTSNASFPPPPSWELRRLFHIGVDDEGRELVLDENEYVPWDLDPKIPVREALGEKRYVAYASARAKTREDPSRTDPSRSGLRTSPGAAAAAETSSSSSFRRPTFLDVDALLSTDGVLAAEPSWADDASYSTVTNMATSDHGDDREMIRMCLRTAHEEATIAPFPTAPTTSTSNPGARADVLAADADSATGSTVLQSTNRYLVKEACKALRRREGQLFLLSVLERRGHVAERADGPPNDHRSASNCLHMKTFQCLVVLCNAMLQACMMVRNFENAYQLLSVSNGFCTPTTGNGSSARKKKSSGSKVVSLTAVVFMHPIFSELDFWTWVLEFHQLDRAKETRDDGAATEPANEPTKIMDGKIRDTINDIGRSMRRRRRGSAEKKKPETKKPEKKESNNVEYECAVATLYEMIEYGVYPDQLVRFATKVGADRGWRSTERGRSLVQLAKSLVKRYDEDDNVNEEERSVMVSLAESIDKQISPINNEPHEHQVVQEVSEYYSSSSSSQQKHDNEATGQRKDVSWFHPSLDNISQQQQQQQQQPLKSYMGWAYTDLSNLGITPMGGAGGRNNEQLRKACVSSVAAFSNDLVVTGGLDGSVFLTDTVHSRKHFAANHVVNCGTDSVNGVSLNWQTNNDASYNNQRQGVGAVTCLAALRGDGYSQRCSVATGGGHNGGTDRSDFDEFVKATKDCRVIAGSSSGALHVWSVKHVYAAVRMKEEDEDAHTSDTFTFISTGFRSNNGMGGDGSSALDITNHTGVTKASEMTTDTTNKSALNGSTLEGHPGGVTCLDLPSPIYRANTFVSGGADGVIKVWSLQRKAGGGGGAVRNSLLGSSHDPSDKNRLSSYTNWVPGSSGGNKQGGSAHHAIITLSGHEGLILSIKTAWHGDRLMSCSADRSIRLWDIAGGGGKCLRALYGHQGMVTLAHYWGKNTVISASTDRTIAIWDVRTDGSPCFMLRHHKCHISDIMVGSRSETHMVSASADGSLASWDLRNLKFKKQAESSTTIRTPMAKMRHYANRKEARFSDSVFLSRGTNHDQSSVLSLGMDGVIKKWEISTGRCKKSHDSGHSAPISCITTLSDNYGLQMRHSMKRETRLSMGGMITCSWDGHVRLRQGL